MEKNVVRHVYLTNVITDNNKTREAGVDSVENNLESSDDLQQLNNLKHLQPLNDSNVDKTLELAANSTTVDCNESKWF